MRPTGQNLLAAVIQFINPSSIEQKEPLSGTVRDLYWILLIAIQYRIIIEPQQSAMIDMVIGVGDTKEICDGHG
jgi:hypothetical protein